MMSLKGLLSARKFISRSQEIFKFAKPSRFYSSFIDIPDLPKFPYSEQLKAEGWVQEHESIYSYQIDGVNSPFLDQFKEKLTEFGLSKDQIESSINNSPKKIVAFDILDHERLQKMSPIEADHVIRSLVSIYGYFNNLNTDFSEEQEKIYLELANEIHKSPELFDSFMMYINTRIETLVFSDRTKELFWRTIDMEPPQIGTIEADAFFVYIWANALGNYKLIHHSISVFTYILQTEPKIYKGFDLFSSGKYDDPEFSECYNSAMHLLTNICTTSLMPFAFLTVLLGNGRLGSLKSGEFLMILERYYKTNNKVVDVKITTAAPLTEHKASFYKNYVKNLFEGDVNIQFKSVIDPAIVDGYILNVDDQEIDRSVRSRQELFKKFFEKSVQ